MGASANQCAIQQTDVAKRRGTQHPSPATAILARLKNRASLPKGEANDKVRQLVGERAGKSEQRDTPHGVAYATQERSA